MLHLLSADHHTHGLDLVARLGGVVAHLGPDLLSAVPGLDGVVVLGTCNRLAILLDAPAATGSRPDEVAGEISEAVTGFLAARADLDALTLRSWHGVDAVAQLFATAAGLESMVIGEREIAGQLRRAMILAHQDRTLTGALARAVEHASTTSRRVACSTGLSGNGRSVVAVGLDLAARQLPPLDGVRVLLVGTGAYAGATVTALRERGVTDLEVYSRSDRVQAFADGHHLRVVTEETLPAALELADLVVTCRGLGAPVLTRELVEPAARLRQPVEPALLDRHEDPCSPAEPPERPLVILDLALMRDVEEAVGSLPGVLLIDLPSVQRSVPEAEAAQVEAARAIVREEVASFTRMAGGRRMDPVITGLRTHVDEMVEREVARLRVRDGVVDADDAARALRRLAARLLHHPSVAARQAGEAGRDEEYLAALPMLLGPEVTSALLAGAQAPTACPVHVTGGAPASGQPVQTERTHD
ncbi:glutamyl-tRNA reductase [Actinomyces faecalis]|uniref:glutamyl-tRNA reductase n=1 Tax=Actinomyces faecalis TaxID=2722820 RepID=UPI001555D3E3|nr:glutamyl-tRNA reductase [Actinomyces faecalis]